MSGKALKSLADILWVSRISAKPCEPLTFMMPELSVEDAYFISRTNMERRCLGKAVQRVGTKIGLTSQVVQKQLGVSEPDFGYVTSDMVLKSGWGLDTTALIQPRVEGETVFVLKKDLKGPGVSTQDVIKATDQVIASIEIVDSRIRDWKIKIQDTVADNASSAYVVLADEGKPLDPAALEKAEMRLWKNGELASKGVGSQCLGNPVNAVVWLANALGRLGETLRAGEFVLSGAFGPVVPFFGGDEIRVEITGVGLVEFQAS